MRFILISDRGERETDRQLTAACAARGVAFTHVVPGAAAGLDLGGPGERRLIYSTGVSLAALTVERLLYRAGDAALHDPFFSYNNQAILFRRAGLPAPRTVYVPDPEPAALARQVASIGGFPVVVKVPGGEGGHGISLAHDLDTLAAAIRDAALPPSLEEYLPHDRCWRVTVLGDRVLAATARAPGDGDFRSNGPGSRMLADIPIPEGLGAIAIKAGQLLKLGFGGADIIETPDGRLALCEFNFPCYFADQQAATGVDIAGAIVEALIAMPPHPTAGRW